MKFSCIFSKRDLSGSLLYLSDEVSISYHPWLHSEFSYMIGAAYTSLDVKSKTGEVVQISGCNPSRVWVSENLTFPKSEVGRLYIHSTEPFTEGTGVSSQHERITYYDSANGYICIGDIAIKEQYECVEFAKDIVAVLNDGELISIWAKITIQ